MIPYSGLLLQGPNIYKYHLDLQNSCWLLIFLFNIFSGIIKNSLKPQDNVYFKCTLTLPDPKGPLAEEVLTVSIINAILISLVW